MGADWSRVSICTGYYAVYFPEHHRAWSTGYVHVHLLAAEQKLGRNLEDGEVVHHIDGNKLNNALENLEICKGHSEHRSRHNKPTTLIELECAFCKKKFSRRKGTEPVAKKYKNAFCSRRCNGKYHTLVA